MSDQAAQQPSAAEVRPTESNVQVVDETAPTYDEQRRRRRRRRRRSVRSEVPANRLRIFLMTVVVLLVLVAATGGQVRQLAHNVTGFVRPLAQLGPLRQLFRLEVVALLFAALILVYLMPGMEDKILRKLGLKHERRGGSGGSSSRRR